MKSEWSEFVWLCLMAHRTPRACFGVGLRTVVVKLRVHRIKWGFVSRETCARGKITFEEVGVARMDPSMFCAIIAVKTHDTLTNQGCRMWAEWQCAARLHSLHAEFRMDVNPVEYHFSCRRS